MTHRRPVGAIVAVAIVAVSCGGSDSAAPPGATEPAPPVSQGVSDSDAAEHDDSSTVPDAGAPTSSEPSPSSAGAGIAPKSSTSTTSEPPAPVPGDCVEDLDLRAQASLLVWPGFEPSQWDDAVVAVDEYDVGGVVLMSPRGWDAAEIERRLAELESRSRHGLIVATDEEGGDVQRLRVLGELASQRTISSTQTPEEAAATVGDHGRAVRGVGVDLVFGPVVDVEPADETVDVPLNPSRFFAGDAASVTGYAAGYLDGWRAAGLFATLKHYPGHGAASADTHEGAGVTPDLEALVERDLVPYSTLADRVRADGDVAVMVGHLTVPGLTDGVPATRSAEAIGYLRDDLGYGDALLITDALGMGAVGLPEAEASILAIEAGIDVVIFTLTSATGDVVDAIVDAVESGRLDAGQIERSAAKVMALLERDGHACDAPNTG